jgi:hypothetical protein
MIDGSNLFTTHGIKNLLPQWRRKKPTDELQYIKSRRTQEGYMSYVFGELSPPLKTPVFVDGAAGLTLAAPALEGGLVLYLRTLSHNVLRAKAQLRGLGRARSDDPPQRIEHLSRGASTLGGCITLREQPPNPQVICTRRSYRVT